MKRIVEQVKTGAVLVSDGGWGTFLQQGVLQPGECIELWNLDHRDVIADIARRYVESGADILKTNSFGGTRFKLELYGLADRVAPINEAAAEISRKAAGPNRHVMASVGPTGKMLLMKDVTEKDLYEAFREQIVALDRGGADAVTVETMSDLDEARLAIQAAKDHTRLEVACTMTFQRTAKGQYRTMMGVTPTQMAETLLKIGVDIIGCNCGNGINEMIHIVREIRKAAPSATILAQPNAGVPEMRDWETVYPDSPLEMATQVPDLIEAGANIVGGCCGTTPNHIRAIREMIRPA